MIIKESQFIIDQNGKYLEAASLPLNTSNRYINTIQVIAPNSMDNTVMVNFTIKGESTKSINEYMKIKTKEDGKAYKGKDVISPSKEEYYELVQDWNVWELPISARVLSELSASGVSKYTLEFQFGELHTIPEAVNYKGTFGSVFSTSWRDSGSLDVPVNGNDGDYWVCNTRQFESQYVNRPLRYLEVLVRIDGEWVIGSNFKLIGYSDKSVQSVQLPGFFEYEEEDIPMEDLIIERLAKLEMNYQDLTNYLDYIFDGKSSVEIKDFMDRLVEFVDWSVLVDEKLGILSTDVVNLKLKDIELKRDIDKVASDLESNVELSESNKSRIEVLEPIVSQNKGDIKDIKQEISDLDKNVKIDNETIIRENGNIRLARYILDDIESNSSEIVKKLNIAPFNDIPLITDLGKIDARYFEASESFDIFIIADKLPPVSEGLSNRIYLIPRQGTSENNIYDEWTLINGKWETLGSLSVDLSDYFTKVEIQTLLNTKANDNEVVKLTGKQEISGDKTFTRVFTDNIKSKIGYDMLRYSAGLTILGFSNTSTITLPTATRGIRPYMTLDNELLGDLAVLPDLDELDTSLKSYISDIDKLNVKEVNGKKPNDQGVLSLGIPDIVDLKAELDNKVDKVNTENRIYGTDNEGLNITHSLSEENLESSVAYRTPTGALRATNAVNLQDLVPLGQLDDKLSDYVKTSVFDLQLSEKLNIKPNGSDLLIIGGKVNPLYLEGSSGSMDHPIVNSLEEMLALDVSVGTVVVRTDLNNQLFILIAEPSENADNWEVVSKDSVISVAGKTGIVTLGITDIDGLNTELTSKADSVTLISEVGRLDGLINLKADKNEVVKLTGDQEIVGKKSFFNNISFQGDIEFSRNAEVSGGITVDESTNRLKMEYSLNPEGNGIIATTADITKAIQSAINDTIGGSY